jgi:hypothetical protein
MECDVTFTKDRELVCRHSQCDLYAPANAPQRLRGGRLRAVATLFAPVIGSECPFVTITRPTASRVGAPGRCW